jgi:BirA family biotin operon repressor/biotin-[acetyl-CoA-carboxylase] ligase
LIGNKKVAGLITEVIGNGVVIGIGINVAMQPSELPVPTATSLFIEGVQSLTRNQLLSDLLKIFETNFKNWDCGSDEIKATYSQMSATIGRKVQVEYPDGQIESAIAVSISSRGELVLDTGAHVQAADIVHLR